MQEINVNNGYQVTVPWTCYTN